MKRADLRVGEEYAWYTSYGFNDNSWRAADDHRWTKVTVVDPGPVERRKGAGYSRKTFNDGVRISYTKGPIPVEEVVQPRRLVRTWADHKKLRAEQMEAHRQAERHRENQRVRRDLLVEFLTDALDDLLRPPQYDRLRRGETLPLSVDDLHRIVEHVRESK